MSILNVNQLQPVGGGNTITVSASDVSASGATITASRFVGEFSSGLNVTGGSVGIGTDNPGELLHLSSATPAIRLTDTDTVGPLHCDIESVSGDLYLDTGSVHRDVVISSVGRANEITRFTGDGKVGIGTDNPQEDLHIGSNSPYILLDDYDNNYKWKLKGTAWFAIEDTTAGEDRLRILSDGKVGIGTDNPNYQTTIAADGANAKLNIKRKTAAASNGNAFGSLFYTNSDGTDVASIRAHRESANDDAYLGFATRNTGGSITERLRVSSDGKLTSTRTSTTAYDSALTTNDSGFLLLNHGAAGHATLQFQSLSGGTAQTGQATISSFNETAGSKNTALTFGTRQNSDATIRERLRITSGGNVAIGTDTTDRQLAIYHDTQATIELKSSDTGQSSLWFTDLSDGNIGGVYYTHNNNKMVLRVSDAARMTITGIGSVGIGEENPINRLHVEDSGVSISSTGDAILNSTQKGIRLINSNNNDTSLGLWFTTGESHHAGISGQRTDSASHWGTDLRFYTHEGATNDLTYTRERLRICCNGLLTNRKGNNAINTGGTILGRYKYTQQNQSQNYEHNILGPDGRNLNSYLTQNVYARIRIQVTGTGTTPCFCEYIYTNNSGVSSEALSHIRGNSSASSNRPYMVLNGQQPRWKMNHSGGYVLDIEVAMYGGKEGYTYTTEYGNFAANP